MNKILFIYNPVSGKGAIKAKLSYIIEKLSEMGIVTIMPTKSTGDATKYVIDYIDDYDIIVCSGGDGTLNEITTGYMNIEKERRKPCGYIPAGTVNDFATTMGISKNIEECANQIIDSVIFPYDIGKFNEKYFNYIAGFGAFTEVAYETSQSIKNTIGKMAYILEGIKHVSKIKGFDVEIDCDGKQYSGNFIYGMICNTFSIGGILKLGEDDIMLDDGKFEAVFVKTPKNPIEIQEVLNDVIMRKLNSKHFLYLRGSNFTINSNDKIRWTIDGECGGDHTEVKIRNFERAIDFIRPKDKK